MYKLLSLWLAACLAAGCGAGDIDLSATLTDVPSPAAAGSSAPRLALTPDGTPVMSWLEPAAENGFSLQFARFEGTAWSPPRQVAHGTNWFINWADFPSVVPLSATAWSAHWLVRSGPAPYAYDVALSHSTDAGTSWSTPAAPHRDGTHTEHGFVSLFPWQGGLGAVWLDGRNTGREGGPMSLRFARFDHSGALLADGVIDERVCDCCMTGVAVADSGPVVVYRDRSNEEIRDIMVRRHDGTAWTAPKPMGNDHWEIPGCPVNGPAITARGDQVAVAWYTAPDRQARIQLARSRDGARTFSTPVVIDAGNVSGRVDVVLLDDGNALVSWIGTTPAGTGQVRIRAVPAGGLPGPIRVIAEIEASRAAGFPKMIPAGDALLFAWTEPGPASQVHTALLPLH